MWLASQRRVRRPALLWFDAAGLAAYATYGAAKALGYGVAPVPAFAMGVLTACVGGIIRDVLAGEPSILMRPELYVTAAALASGLFVGLALLGLAPAGCGSESPPWPVSRCAGSRSPAAGRCPPTTTRLAALQHRRHDGRVTEEFYRIQRLPPYVFAEVNAMKAAARARGEDIIDLGMGNPDGAPPQHVIDKLAEVAAKPNAHRYSASRGIPGLRKAQAAYYQRRFGVDARSGQGSHRHARLEGRARQPRPGDHRARRRRAGAQPVLPDPQLRLHHRRRGDPLDPGRAGRATSSTRLDSAMRYTVPRPKVLVVGYPSNPTAYVADLAFYERLVAFAREHELIVISDLAYAEIYFGDTPTPSILQVEGAKDVAVEFTSMSKTYSMAGWRIGFAVGNARLIAALARVKSYLDYGAFTPIQAAAVAALNGPQDIVEHNRALYHKRRDVLVECFGRAGWDDPRARRPRCSPGRRSRSASATSAHGILQAAADRGPCRGRAGRRLRRGRRRLRPHRAGRERAAPAPGGARREEDAGG